MLRLKSAVQRFKNKIPGKKPEFRFEPGLVQFCVTAHYTVHHTPRLTTTRTRIRVVVRWLVADAGACHVEEEAVYEVWVVGGEGEVVVYFGVEIGVFTVRGTGD